MNRQLPKPCLAEAIAASALMVTGLGAIDNITGQQVGPASRRLLIRKNKPPCRK